MCVTMRMTRGCICDIDLGIISSLEHDTYLTIEWFENNYMKVNTEKCHLYQVINSNTYGLTSEVPKYGKVIL